MINNRSLPLPAIQEREKREVHSFWNEWSCGEALYLDRPDIAGYQAQAEQRYRLEPYIPEFAKFAESGNKKVLEIGVGLGADHEQFAKAGAELSGIDLTERAFEHTRNRLALLGLSSKLEVADCEALPYPDASFDVVYAWGVLHHSPNTPGAINEVYRVLQPRGVARVMIYQKWSLIGLMLWVRYALLRAQPWKSLSWIYANYLESPGTKAYTPAQAQALFSKFSKVNVSSVLTHGDLLESQAGQRHNGVLLDLARRLWPRALLKRLLPNQGLFLLIEAVK